MTNYTMILNHSMYRTTKQAQIFTAFALTGVLSVSSAVLPIKSATAAPKNLYIVPAQEVLKENTKTNSLPQAVARSVVQDLSRRERIPARQLEITDYSQETWRNGCLELPRGDELCTQVLVPGWRVVLSDGNQTWVYHTNSNGRFLRLASAGTPSNNLKNLPQYIRRAVIEAASRRLNVPTNRLRVIEAEQRTWSDGCLGLGGPAESCIQVLTPGWRVVVSAPEQTLVLHTNETASQVRLNENASQTGDRRLPRTLRNAVLEEASQYTKLPISQLRIVDAQRVTTNGCLNLPRSGEACTEIALRAWKVEVQAGEQRLVFHAHPNGRDVRLNVAASNFALPQPVINGVLRDASSWSNLPSSRLRIVQAERHTWTNPCELTFNRVCSKAYIPTPGWIVTVDSGSQLWVYHVNENASIIALDRAFSLSEAAAQVIKQDAARRSDYQSSLSDFRIIKFQQLRDWNGACEGIRNCTRPIAPGWEATVSNGQQSWVYRVRENGSEFELENQVVFPGSLQPVRIPWSELPPSLDGGVIFREITSGGFAGETYETILLEDGRLISVRVDDFYHSQRKVRRVSSKVVRDFQRLLEQQSDEFNNLGYPPPRGAADYFSYTLTSRKGTVEYNDISQSNLPQDLIKVVTTWNRIKTSAQG
jgi:hypothetical protein